MRSSDPPLGNAPSEQSECKQLRQSLLEAVAWVVLLK